MTIAPSPTSYAAPGEEGSLVTFRSRYDHFIGGEYVPPTGGQYFENPTPVTGRTFTEVARGDATDVDRAVAAAWKAFPAWGRTSVAERAGILNKIADRMEANLEMLAVAETWENGKPIRDVLPRRHVPDRQQRRAPRGARPRRDRPRRGVHVAVSVPVLEVHRVGVQPNDVEWCDRRVARMEPVPGAVHGRAVVALLRTEGGLQSRFNQLGKRTLVA